MFFYKNFKALMVVEFIMRISISSTFSVTCNFKIN